MTPRERAASVVALLIGENRERYLREIIAAAIAVAEHEARAKALEEAAQVADMERQEAAWAFDTANDIATKIRALVEAAAPPDASRPTNTKAGGPDVEPIPMILFCPDCGAKHVDASEPENGWTNPPHKSHRCKQCGTIWRPADVPTTGVEKIATRGNADTWVC